MVQSDNNILERAKKQKKDELYTRLEDSERELAHYKEHFRGRTVLCNCDNPRVSNSVHYFSCQFERLGRNCGGPASYIKRDGKLVRLYDRIVIRRRKK